MPRTVMRVAQLTQEQILIRALIGGGGGALVGIVLLALVPLSHTMGHVVFCGTIVWLVAWSVWLFIRFRQAPDVAPEYVDSDAGNDAGNNAGNNLGE